MFYDFIVASGNLRLGGYNLIENIVLSAYFEKVSNFVTFEQVITTYATLGSDFSKATQATRHGSGFAEQFCPLLTVNWWRVVLDESHTVSSFLFVTIIRIYNIAWIKQGMVVAE